MARPRFIYQVDSGYSSSRVIISFPKNVFNLLTKKPLHIYFIAKNNQFHFFVHQFIVSIPVITLSLLN